MMIPRLLSPVDLSLLKAILPLTFFAVVNPCVREEYARGPSYSHSVANAAT